jgi:hypothetical protein
MFDGVKPGVGLGVRKAASRAPAGSDAAPKAATPSTSAMIRCGTHKPYLCCLHAWLRLGSSSAPCASSSVVSTGTTPRFTRASVACQRICAFPALHKHAQACEHLQVQGYHTIDCVQLPQAHLCATRRERPTQAGHPIPLPRSCK